MTREKPNVRDEVRQALTVWHATHPAVTFAEIEGAVEDQTSPRPPLQIPALSVAE